MKITKYGHCCLLLEPKGVRILTDPGSYTTQQNEVTDLAAVLITHEHTDHLHVDSVQAIVKNNPQVVVLTNASVGKILDAATIPHKVIESGTSIEVLGVTIEAFDAPHAEIYRTLPIVPNTAFMIDGQLFYPGDALMNPKRKVDILALPIAGPWVKISEAIDYALEIKPRVCFPVHDGGQVSPDFLHNLTKGIITPDGVELVSLVKDTPTDL